MRTIGLLIAGGIVLASGIWLTRSGRPYGVALLNVHKLVDLVAVVVIGVAVYQANRAAPLSPADWAVTGAAGLVVIATFATGGVASGMQAPPTWAVTAHRVASWGAALLAVVSVYLISTR